MEKMIIFNWMIVAALALTSNAFAEQTEVPYDGSWQSLQGDPHFGRLKVLEEE